MLGLALILVFPSLVESVGTFWDQLEARWPVSGQDVISKIKAGK